MPAAFTELATKAAACAGYDGFAPDACLINRCEPGARVTQQRAARPRIGPWRRGGIGLMFAPVEGTSLHIGGVDLDSCRNPETGEIDPWVQDVIDRFKTYTEISPSQTGVKLFFTYLLADKPEIYRLLDSGNIEPRLKPCSIR
jgi:hypothetical protein